MTVLIRDAAPADETQWRALWSAYLAYYRTDLAPQVTDATWARILDPDSRMSCRLAEQDGSIVGFAVWHHHLASWHVADDCYLEDLFVAPDARGGGVGRALLDALFALARARGFGRIYWHTNTDNARARALYDSYAPADGHIRYRLSLQH
jgi:GNAT superfamily N-acetyltransferase